MDACRIAQGAALSRRINRSVMHYTRIYSDESGESRFETVAVPLTDRGIVGFLSETFPVQSLQFRENSSDYHWDYHNAPARQFIVLLDGQIEITSSIGERRVFGAGDILLVEDTTGKGHKTRNLLQHVRKSIFIRL
jgi:uncharacterized cupin superfamily protein